MHRNFDHRAGEYSMTKKGDIAPVEQTVSISVDGAVLETTYHGYPENVRVTGEIIMDERHPRSGEGYYEHWVGDEPYWGWYRAQIAKSGELLVHTQWFNVNVQHEWMDAWTWRRIGPPRSPGQPAPESRRRTSIASTNP
jgi:hypothetical protein